MEQRHIKIKCNSYVLLTEYMVHRQIESKQSKINIVVPIVSTQRVQWNWTGPLNHTRQCCDAIIWNYKSIFKAITSKREIHISLDVKLL